MKTYISKTFKGISLMLMLFLVGGILLSSCQKEDPTAPLEATAPPVIERIRLIDPAKADSSLQSSTLGSTIVIVGQNLAATQYVVFNGLETPINPVYATETHLIITIPSNTPTVATDPNVPNELKVVNGKGEATVAFAVLPPAPEVDRIQNEYAVEGSQLKLTGSYFFFVEEVSLPGGVVVPGSAVTTSADGTTLSLTVPAGVDFSQGRDIIVETQSGSSATSRTTKLYGGQGMLVDWDTRTSWDANKSLNSLWGLDGTPENVTSTFEGINAWSGLFGLINTSIPAGWGWSNSKVVHMQNNDGSQNNGQLFPTTPAAHYGPNEPLANLDLKFEVASTKPVGELLVQIWQSNGGKDYTVNVPLKNFVMSADGQWYTVTVNLGDMASGDGAKLAKYSDLTAPTDLRLVIQNPTGADIPASMAIDNIRIVNNTK